MSSEEKKSIQESDGFKIRIKNSTKIITGGNLKLGDGEEKDRLKLPPKIIDVIPESDTEETSDPVDTETTNGSNGITPAGGTGTDYSQHIFLRGRDAGACRKLIGKILFCFVYVNHPDTNLFFWKSRKKWNKTEMEDLAAREEAISYIVQEAQKENIKIECSRCDFSIDADTPDKKQGEEVWTTLLAKQNGFDSLDKMYAELKKLYNVEQVAFAFMTKYSGRSFASISHYKGLSYEYVILFKNGYKDKRVVLHELLHLFGAEDLYFHKTVVENAKKYFPKSVMLSSRNYEIDNLTRYLIGWHDVPKDDAVAFLEATKNIDAQEFEKERSLNRRGM